MNQEIFHAKRVNWLKEVADQCHKYATQLDVDFYVFQTPCEQYNPDLLIIGINPGGGKGYNEMLLKNHWVKRPFESLQQDVNTLTTKPYWEIESKEKGADYMRFRMSKVFTAKNNLKEILENAVMMNICYFNTKDESLMNKSISQEVQNFCAIKTLEFIEILNPKNILIISSSVKNIGKLQVRGTNQINKFIKEGFINDRRVYTIPHYASRTGAYSEIEGNDLGVKLKSLFKE